MAQELGISLSGVREGPAAAGPRQAIEWAAGLGYRAIQIDVTAPGLRPRELDRSARRGLTTMLRLLQVRLAGLDLWIPSGHFSDPARQQRALDAVEAAAVLSAELSNGVASAPISLSLPEDAGDIRSVINTAAARHGVLIADFGPGRTGVKIGEPIGAGFDPAEALAAGLDVAAEVARAGSGLVAVRLADWNGRRRVEPGKGRLDLLAFGVALSVAGYSHPIVVDLRDVDDRISAAARARDVWPPV